MGLPGSGKTTLAKKLVNALNFDLTVLWLNADKIREEANDWDFSETGRIRQSFRMRTKADNSLADVVVCDFVAPFPVMRYNFTPDFTIWMNTIKLGRFDDTNKIFLPPLLPDSEIVDHIKDPTDFLSRTILKRISNLDSQKT